MPPHLRRTRIGKDLGTPLRAHPADQDCGLRSDHLQGRSRDNLLEVSPLSRGKTLLLRRDNSPWCSWCHSFSSSCPYLPPGRAWLWFLYTFPRGWQDKAPEQGWLLSPWGPTPVPARAGSAAGTLSHASALGTLARAGSPAPAKPRAGCASRSPGTLRTRSAHGRGRRARGRSSRGRGRVTPVTRRHFGGRLAP